MRQVTRVVDLPPDQHRHVVAASAWMDVGAYLAANDELDEIAPELRAFPEVLIIRAKIYNAAGRYLDAATVAQAVVRARPEEESSWVQLASYQEREEIRGFETALLTLQQALKRFPCSCELWFQAARLLAALGEPPEAEIAFQTAIELAEKRGDETARDLKLRAFDDYHIGQLLWPEG